MAVILATVDIEDLATAKVAGIKDALTDLTQSQQQIAASSGALSGSLSGFMDQAAERVSALTQHMGSLSSALSGSLAFMQQAAQGAVAFAQGMAEVGQRIVAAIPPLQQAGSGLEVFFQHFQQSQAAIASNNDLITSYIGALAALAQAAQQGLAPLEAQAGALRELSQVTGVAGLSEFSADLGAMADQLSKGVPLTKEQTDALTQMAAGMSEAQRATVTEVTALEALAHQTQLTATAVRETYSGLQLLTQVMTEGSTVTKLQAEALAEMAQTAAAGNGFTQQQADTLRQLSEALQAGVVLTREQADELARLTEEYGRANVATQAQTSATEQLIRQEREAVAVIRETSQALTLLSEQMRAGTIVTEAQAAAIAELTKRAQEGNGFTQQQAASLKQLSESMKAGEEVTEENAEALKEVSAGYKEVNAATVGFSHVTNEAIGPAARLKGNLVLVAATLGLLGGAMLSYLTEATKMAARTEVLGVVLLNVGKNAYQNSLDMMIAVNAIKKLGITTDEATNAVIKFINAELKVADASKLARVAQDLAVVAGINSSQAFERLTHAIEAQSAMMLRSFGIVTGLSTIYSEYARTLGKTGRELDAVEKKQAFLNKILEEGEKRQGTYEASMEKAGKQYTSLDRLIEEVKNAIGQRLLPIFSTWITALTDLYNMFLKLSPAVQTFTSALLTMGAAMALIGGAISGAKLLGLFELISKIIPALRAATVAFAAARAGAAATVGAFGMVGTAAVAGVGPVTAFGRALSAAFGSPMVAGITLVVGAIALATAAWVTYKASSDESTQKTVEQIAAQQAQIDKISKLQSELVALEKQGSLTTEQQAVYNEKLTALKALVPGVTAEMNRLTGAYNLNEDAIIDTLHVLTQELNMRAEIARGQVDDQAIAYSEAMRTRIDLEKQAADLSEHARQMDAAGAVQEAKAARAGMIILREKYNEARKDELLKESAYRTSQRLTLAIDRETDAIVRAADALTEHKEKLETAAGGRAELLKQVGTVPDMKDFKRDFDLFEKGLRFNPKTKQIVKMDADEIIAAARRIGEALQDQRDAQAKLAEQHKQQIKAARKSVDEMIDIDHKEQARYDRLNERLTSSGRNTEIWGQQVNDAKSLLMQFLHSVDFGTGKFAELEAGVKKIQFDKYLKLPEDTVIEYNALNAALEETTGNTDAYNAVLEANKGKIQAVNQMTAEQRKQIQANGEVIANATLQLQQYADEQLRIGQAEAGGEAAKARLALVQELETAERGLAQEEADAARERRDAQIEADEAIRQSRLKLQDDIASQRMEGMQLEAYRVRRQIEDLQHAFDLERQQRALALADQREANRQRYVMQAAEIKARADAAIAAKELDDRLTISMLENAAMVKAAHGDKEAMAKAAADVARIREGTRIFAEGVRERQDMEEAALRDTEYRLEAMVKLRADAEARMTADQKKALDAQIANLQHYLSTLRLGLEVVRQGWEGLKGIMVGVADEFTKGLSEMMQGTKSFTEAMKDLWGSIRSAFFNLVADMVKTWLQGLIKMALAAAQRKLLGSVMAGGAAAGVGASGVDEGEGAGVGMGGSLMPSGGGTLTRGQKALGAAGAAVVGGAVGYGVGRGTGSYAAGIGAGAGAGAAAGAQFGPWGALVGGAVGAIAGWFGARKARQQAEEERKKFIDSWSGGLEELKKKAEEAGASLADLNSAKTPEKVAEAIKELEKAFELQKAKESLGETYDGLRELQRQAQNLGYDIKKLYDADTIEEFNREQEHLNELLEEQARRIEGLNTAAEGVNQWAEGLSKTLGQRFEEAFPDKERMNKFSEAFKEAVGKGYAGTIAEFSKVYQQELQKISFAQAQQGSKDTFKDARRAGFKGTEDEFKKLQEAVQKAFGATFKGTKAEYDRIMAEAVETSKRLGEVAKVSQSEFNALGTTAAATFAGMIKETGDLYGAMKAIEPTLNILVQAQKEWGLQGDETFNSLMKFQRVIKENEGIFQSLSGMTQALKGLSEAGALTEETFDSMGRTAVEKFDALNKKTGDHKMSLLAVSPTLQALWEAQKKYGFSVDENTQKLIDQGIEQGTVGANMQSVNQKMLDVMGLIAQELGVAKEKLVELGLVARDPIIDPAAADEAERLANQTAEAREEQERQRQAGIDAGTDTARATEEARERYFKLREEAEEARRKIAELGGAGTTSGGQIDAGTAEAIKGLQLIIDKAAEAEIALRNMGQTGVTAGQNIEGAATGAAEGHSPTGIKQITFRVKEAEAALVSFSDLFAEKARNMEAAAGSLSSMAIAPEEVLKVAPGVQPTNVASGAVTIQVTQEGPVISVNALDNANMEEAWRTKIMPEYLKHIDNNADQLAERTENAISRHRRKVS